MNTTAELPPTLAQMQYKLSYIQTDDQIRHIEDGLPMDNPRRNELNTLRRQFAGIMHRLEHDLNDQREQLAAKPLSTPPKKGWRRHTRTVLAVAVVVVALGAVVFASATAGAALVVAAITP